MKHTIIITGAAGNLGKSVVEHFLNEDWQIGAAVGPGDNPALFNGLNILTQKFDLTNEESTSLFFNKVADKFGNVKGAVLTVGGFGMGNIENTGETELMEMYNLNFLTAFHSVKALLKIFEKQGTGGQIVLMGAKPALKPEAAKGSIAYALSKGLVIQLADIINASFAKEKIVCSVIAPSIIDTPPNRDSMPDADFSKWVKPENIAELISFIFSDSGKMLRKPVFRMFNES